MQRVRVKHEPYQALRAESGRQRAFPSLQPTLILNLGASLTVFDVCGGSISVDAGEAFYAGLHDKVCYTESEGLQRGIHVRMSALDAFKVFGPNVAQCGNRAFMFEDVVGADQFRNMAGSGWGMHGPFSKYAVPSEIEWAWEQLATGHVMRIADLTNELAWSRKRLVQRFRAVFGVGPKTVARLARFDALRHRLKVGNRSKWVDHAHDFGYFDQPHMIRDVKEFTGLSPTALVTEMRRNNYPIQDAQTMPSVALAGE